MADMMSMMTPAAAAPAPKKKATKRKATKSKAKKKTATKRKAAKKKKVDSQIDKYHIAEGGKQGTTQRERFLQPG